MLFLTDGFFYTLLSYFEGVVCYIPSFFASKWSAKAKIPKFPPEEVSLTHSPSPTCICIYSGCLQCSICMGNRIRHTTRSLHWKLLGRQSEAFLSNISEMASCHDTEACVDMCAVLKLHSAPQDQMYCGGVHTVRLKHSKGLLSSILSHQRHLSDCVCWSVGTFLEFYAHSTLRQAAAV